MNDDINSALTPARLAAAIAKTLATVRRERGLSLQEVADRAGLSKSHVWDLEKGRSRNPTIGTAVNLARALGVSLDRLTGLSTSEVELHPEAHRIACEVDALIRAALKAGGR